MEMQMSKKISEYKAVILDVDGTLYFQPPLRMKMALKLVFYYGTHFWKLKDLFIIKTFREVREHWTKELDEEKQYQAVAKMKNTTSSHVRTLINHWIYDFPLPYLDKYKDRELVKIVERLNDAGVITAAYSDYPVEKKLEAMKIHLKYHFSAEDTDIMCLKPDPRGMEIVLKKLNLSPDQVLMIGDRYSKDGLSAISQNVDYVILPSSPEKRNKVIEIIKRGI